MQDKSDNVATMAQQYSLKWNNHQPNFISMFAMLRNTQALVDVTLAAEGRHLHAHKMVLSACSPYFHSLFVENPSQHPIVILKDVAFSDLRTIVDFMYYGEVNITQEELPQMLHSAKSLKVKGLTETESTAVMRSQSSDFPYETSGETSGEPTGESLGDKAEIPSEPSNDRSNESTGEGSQRRPSASPNNSPASKRRRRRRSSTVSTSLNNIVGEENRDDQTMEIVRDGITLSSVPRRRDYSHDESNAQQNTEPHNISIDDLNVDHNSACMTSQDMLASLRLRRATLLKRQARILEERGARRQVSEPSVPVTAPVPQPPLRKNNSYPPCYPPDIYIPITSPQQQAGSQPDRANADRSQPVSKTPSLRNARTESPFRIPAMSSRASHTPAVRSGPPLSCNFCWNTVDKCGRILRRKTQYHCPECRTNLCIVPCFHEYHEAETEIR